MFGYKCHVDNKSYAQPTTEHCTYTLILRLRLYNHLKNGTLVEKGDIGLIVALKLITANKIGRCINL